MLRRLFGRLVDVYLVGSAAWMAAWAVWRDTKGALGLFNAWTFWLLSPAVGVGAARLWASGRNRPAGKLAAAAWLAATGGAVLDRYRWPVTTAQIWLLRRLPGPGSRQINAQPAQPRPQLRVLSLNVLKENEDADAVIQLIRSQAPDVVLIQELEPEMNRRIQEGLQNYDHCEWQCHRRPGGGFGFYSRYAFEVTGSWQGVATRPFAARITVQTPAMPVDLYNVHLLAISANAIRRTGLAGNFRLREQQMAELAQMMLTGGRPALALGDYNMTEGNQAYRIATATLADAWLAAGLGPGWTWPAAEYPPYRPALRLDYCFCTMDVRPLAMRVVRDPIGSDHCPVVVDIALPQPAMRR